MQAFIIKLINLIPYYKKKMVYTPLFFLISSCIQTINSPLPQAVSLVSGNQTITISSPLGFCVDQRLANQISGSITLFIIDCVEVKGPNGVTARRRPLSAILTATVIDYNIGDLNRISDLEEVLTKKPGINYLSKSNTTATLKVHLVESNEHSLLFLIEQRPSNIGVKQSDYFWRIFFFTNGKLVVMTASNFSDGKSSQLKLKKLLREFYDKTLVANAR